MRPEIERELAMMPDGEQVQRIAAHEVQEDVVALDQLPQVGRGARCLGQPLEQGLAIAGKRRSR
jgi:hypothetical protein